jgi:uncharacterized membrane protein
MRPESHHTRLIFITTLAAMLLPELAAAYVGPGAGISMLGALWGLIIGVVMAIGVILFWPIRIVLRKMKANKAAADDTTVATAEAIATGSAGSADPANEPDNSNTA